MQPCVSRSCHRYLRQLAFAAALFVFFPQPQGVAIAAPVARVGELWFGSPAATAPYHKAFVDGLTELGYVEGKNLLLFTRYAEGDESRIPSLLKELLGLRVDVLLVTGKAVDAAKKATTSVPIICATMADPVGAGQVVSLARPGGNLTGVSWQTVETASKRIELARELVPNLAALGLLYDATDHDAQVEAQLDEHVARQAGIRVLTFEVRGMGDIQATLAVVSKKAPQVLLVVDSPVTAAARKEIGESVLTSRIPMISEGRVFAESGGVLTYGAKLIPALKRGAAFVDKILKGANPVDLPIEQPTEFELVVNVKAAKITGVRIPSSILNRADEVIR